MQLAPDGLSIHPTGYKSVGSVLTFLLLVTLALTACTSSTPGPPATPYPTLERPLPTLTPGPPRTAEFIPPTKPRAAAGEAKYKELCVTCHGEAGQSDTALARTLSPRPANFHDLEFLRRRTPSSLYRSIAKGVLGTGMLAYEGQLNEQERWDVLFFLWDQHVKPEEIARGQRLYAETCAECHGSQGEGGQATSLADPRLAMGRTGYGIYNAISGGLADPASHRWDRLSEADRWAIVEYIWTFMYQRP